MKADGRLTRAGKVLLGLTAAWLLFLGHSALVQYHTWQGLRLLERDEPARVAAWWQQPQALAALPAESRARWREGDAHLEAADRWGLVGDSRIARERSWAALVDSRLPDATKHLREAIRRRPDPTTWRELGHVLMLQGDWEPAIGALREAVGHNPGDANAHGMLAQAFIRIDDLPQAIAEQRTFVQLSGRPDARLQLATWLLAGGDARAGIAELEALVAEHPKYAVARVTLGRALEQVGRAADAAAQLAEAERLEPGILKRMPALDSGEQQAPPPK
jgi:predicted Zn-dependent protease